MAAMSRSDGSREWILVVIFLVSFMALMILFFRSGQRTHSAEQRGHNLRSAGSEDVVATQDAWKSVLVERG